MAPRMAKTAHVSETPATAFLKKNGVVYGEHTYPYEEKGGTRTSSERLGVPEHVVVKTLVMEDESRRPLVVLMHGDREVSTKNLARVIGVRATSPCAPAVADKHSGYQVGGTSPFGLKRPMPVYLERTIAELSRIYINGGARGFLVSLAPTDAIRVLSPTLVDVAVPRVP